MEDLQLKDLQIQGLQEQLDDLFSSIKNSKRKRLDIADIKQKLKEYDIALDGANIELRHVGNDNKQEWKNILLTHKQKLKELKTQYTSIELEINKQELFSTNHKQDDMETPQALMDYGLDIQKQSKESLQHTITNIHRASEVGHDTVRKLEANANQITNLYDTLEIIESSFNRSAQKIKRLVRRVASDKVIWVISFLIMVVVIVIIVLKVRGNSNPSDITTFSSSTGTNV